MPASETNAADSHDSVLVRPERHTVLRSFAGHLEAAPDAVFAALVHRMTGAPGVAVNAAAHEIVQQGGWWYRGEYRVMAEPNEPNEPDENGEAGATGTGLDVDAGAAASGTRLEFEIVNVAQSWHRAGEFTGRKVLAEAPYGFHALLSDIEAELAEPDLDGSHGSDGPTN